MSFFGTCESEKVVIYSVDEIIKKNKENETSTFVVRLQETDSEYVIEESIDSSIFNKEKCYLLKNNEQYKNCFVSGYHAYKVKAGLLFQWRSVGNVLYVDEETYEQISCEETIYKSS